MVNPVIRKVLQILMDNPYWNEYFIGLGSQLSNTSIDYLYANGLPPTINFTAANIQSLISRKLLVDMGNSIYQLKYDFGKTLVYCTDCDVCESLQGPFYEEVEIERNWYVRILGSNPVIESQVSPNMLNLAKFYKSICGIKDEMIALGFVGNPSLLSLIKFLKRKNIDFIVKYSYNADGIENYGSSVFTVKEALSLKYVNGIPYGTTNIDIAPMKDYFGPNKQKIIGFDKNIIALAGSSNTSVYVNTNESNRVLNNEGDYVILNDKPANNNVLKTNMYRTFLDSGVLLNKIIVQLNDLSDQSLVDFVTAYLDLYLPARISYQVISSNGLEITDSIKSVETLNNTSA